MNHNAGNVEVKGSVVVADGECLEYERLSATLTSAVGFTASKYAAQDGKNCVAVLVTVETAAIRFTMDGTTPTVTAGTSQGHKILADYSYVVRGTTTISQFLMINEVASNGAIAHCSYFFA